SMAGDTGGCSGVVLRTLPHATIDRARRAPVNRGFTILENARGAPSLISASSSVPEPRAGERNDPRAFEADGAHGRPAPRVCTPSSTFSLIAPPGVAPPSLLAASVQAARRAGRHQRRGGLRRDAAAARRRRLSK